MNIKAAIIAGLVTAVIAGLAVWLLGESIAIPPGWRTAMVGGIAGGVAGYFLMRKKQDEKDTE
jgi:membrane protease YdiL (CAAX protease family)